MTGARELPFWQEWKDGRGYHHVKGVTIEFYGSSRWERADALYLCRENNELYVVTAGGMMWIGDLTVKCMEVSRRG